jgi:hypothetical protein
MFTYRWLCHADEGSIPTHLSRKKGKRSFVPQDDNKEKKVTIKNIHKHVTFVASVTFYTVEFFFIQ